MVKSNVKTNKQFIVEEGTEFQISAISSLKNIFFAKNQKYSVSLPSWFFSFPFDKWISLKLNEKKNFKEISEKNQDHEKEMCL